MQDGTWLEKPRRTSSSAPALPLRELMGPPHKLPPTASNFLLYHPGRPQKCSYVGVNLRKHRSKKEQHPLQGYPWSWCSTVLEPMVSWKETVGTRGIAALQQGRTSCYACDEPPPRRVKEVPTERWDKPPYPHGTKVTYRCRPGYIKLGRIVFECADGAWKQLFPGTECRNKPCGHPGDTEFGSFELTSGSEFVFGARVEYRCDDGYWMLSQRNYRECKADGWSNDIPHCEVAKCLPVQAPENGRIITTGAFELGQEYSFGQVVKFECNAKYKLVGAKEIICSSNGKWNSDVPQCQEIICDVPKILHGYVRSPKASYKETEQLQFACDKGYRYHERADARCTASGWNPIPYCT
ncbi:PREDICTED: complement factor H, partial [Nestor notabilis]|uniref:complement factor H n=1 Tax=Nestor notabilis TaxID=176057 RepID=UPI000523EE4F